MSRREHRDTAVLENLGEVFTKRIVAIGENHQDVAPKKFLAQNTVFLRSQGYNTVLFEHLSKGHNETLWQLKFPGQFQVHISQLDIRDIVARAKSKFPGQEILNIDIENDYPPDPFSPFEKLLFNIFQSDFGHTYNQEKQLTIKEYDEILTNDQSNKFNFLKVVKELLINGVNVVGIENSQEIYRSQAGYERAKYLNASILYSLGQFLTTTAADQKAIVFVGNRHLQRHPDRLIPGISCPTELANLQKESIQEYFNNKKLLSKKLFQDNFFPQLIANTFEQGLAPPPAYQGDLSPPPEETYWPVVSLDNAKSIQQNISSISFFQTRRKGGTFNRELIFINTNPNECLEFNGSKLYAERIVCFDKECDLKILGGENLVTFFGRIADGRKILLAHGDYTYFKTLYERASTQEQARSSGEAASLVGAAAAAMEDNETSMVATSGRGAAAASMPDDETSMVATSGSGAAAASMPDDETSMVATSGRGAAAASMSLRVPKRPSSSTLDVEEEAVFNEANSVEDKARAKKERQDRAPEKALGSGPIRLSKGPRKSFGRVKKNTKGDGAAPD